MKSSHQGWVLDSGFSKKTSDWLIVNSNSLIIVIVILIVAWMSRNSLLETGALSEV